MRLGTHFVILYPFKFEYRYLCTCRCNNLKESFLEVWQISPKTSSIYLYFLYVMYWTSCCPNSQFHAEPKGLDGPAIKAKHLSDSSALYSLCICSWNVGKRKVNLCRLCKILCFGRGVFEAFCLLGCWAAYVGKLLRTSRDSVLAQSARKEEFFLGILSPEDQKHMLSRNSRQ